MTTTDKPKTVSMMDCIHAFAVPGKSKPLTPHTMKFVKVQNRRGFNYNHGTKYTVTDLKRSNETHNFEAGTNRMPRCDSKFWNHNFMVWDAAGDCQIHRRAS